MVLQTLLKVFKNIYLGAKIIQLVLHSIYICYLLSHREEKDTSLFLYISCYILFGVLVSHYRLFKKADKIFAENGNYMDFYVIAFDLINFAIAAILYPIIIHETEVKYEDKMELYYAHHRNDSFKLKVNDVSSSEDILNDTIELISFMNIKENSTEMIDASLGKYNGTKVDTFIQEPSDQIFEAFYYMYVTLRLKTPAKICILIHGFVVVLLGCVECIKYRIRKAAVAPQPAIEMDVIAVTDN